MSFRNLAITIAVALPLGCSAASPAPSPVEGTVTFLGRPLTGGLVVFTPDAGRGSVGKPVAAKVAVDGSYRFPTLASGWYRVSLSDQSTGSAVDGFPAELRRPDRSGLIRQILPGRAHRIDFLIDSSHTR